MSEHNSGDEDGIHNDSLTVMANQKFSINIKPFNESEVSWSTYVTVLKHQFRAQNVPPEKQVDLFLGHVGFNTVESLINILHPVEPGTRTFDELCRELGRRLEPEPSSIRSRTVFGQRMQQQGETVMEYISALKVLTKHCKFNETLEDRLRDQLVVGLKSERIRQRLFEEGDNLSWARASEIALSVEAAVRYASEVNQNQSVNKVQFKPKSAARRQDGVVREKAATMINQLTCYCCGEKGHTRPRCPKRKSTCEKCGKKGHISKVCYDRNDTRNNKAIVNSLEEQGSSDSEEDDKDSLFCDYVVVTNSGNKKTTSKGNHVKGISNCCKASKVGLVSESKVNPNIRNR
ncbi:uncharacterized protein LOC124172760 [Ischnura elegans]|uniref:uncharacterized protein LOC124172760 n=1 Tax=Ischnura elegans TaxID=197161 RepID=UPI001ED89D0F|nr:uncharacterized protein LOC124172760 [Ischnura elegans]